MPTGLRGPWCLGARTGRRRRTKRRRRLKHDDNLRVKTALSAEPVKRVQGHIHNTGEIRRELEASERHIQSETDTELIAHLIDGYIEDGKDLLTAVRMAASRLQGSYAFGALSHRFQDHIVVAKNGGSPMIIGLGDKQTFMASDIPAILPYTRDMVFLEDGDFAVLSEEGVQVVDIDAHPLDRTPKPIQWDPISAEKGGYDRFMQKEIFEQPRAILDTIGTRVLEEEGDIDIDGIDPAFAPGVSHYEPGGLTVREVLDMVHALPGPIIGADVVEYNPHRDVQAMTANVAAKLVRELAGQIVSKNVSG